MQNVTEVSIDEALQDIVQRRKMARRNGDKVAQIVLGKQLDRLLLMKYAQMQGRPTVDER